MRIRFEILPAAYVMAAAVLLILPIEWIISVISAAAVHELGHLAALRFSRMPECRLQIGLWGVKIETGGLLPAQEVLCALAGPAASFGLLLLHSFPALGLIGLIQGLFNLLPIYPLDGGRALQVLLECLIPGQADLFMKVAEWVTLVGFWVLLWRLDQPGWMILPVFLLVGKSWIEKFLAKMGRSRYNGSD